MPLAAGQSLSFYEILGPLGAGGMGEVYRARDTRLDREVAIKVLPEELADDEERLRRFEREARLLASLNHPNVAGIHGVDQEGDVYFLALELVPGEDLATRLKRGALSVDEAIDVCRQIAEGLEAAHEAGVVHRDLKPANVRITADGKVKLLDFGLAKPTGPDSDGASITDSVLATEEGRLLGTPTYMAPEQARGKPIDRRVDVWAFGCVLYECLTAKRGFDGETISDVIVSLLEREPDWTLLPPDLPPRILTLLQRCLRKDPGMRLPSAGMVRILIREYLEDPGGTEEAPASIPTASKSGPSRVWILAIALLSLLTGWFLESRLFPPEPAARLLTRTNLVLDPPVEMGMSPVFSEDGRTLVYAARIRGDTLLYRRDLSEPESFSIDGTEGGLFPFFSPDGRWVGFFSAGRLKKVRVEGGQPIPIGPYAGYAYGGVWTEEDQIIFHSSGYLLPRIVSASGGAVQPISAQFSPEERVVGQVRRIPDTRKLLVTVVHLERREESSVVLLDLDGGGVTTLTAGSDAFWVEPNLVLYHCAGLLMAAPLDLRSGRITESARVVPMDLKIYESSAGRFIRGAVTATGTALLEVSSASVEDRVVWTDWSGQTVRETEVDFVDSHQVSWSANYSVRFSPDGTKLLGSGGAEVHVIDLEDGSDQVIFQESGGGANLAYAHWHPSGESVALISNRDGAYRTYRVSADGLGGLELLTDYELAAVGCSYSPDGEVLAGYFISPVTNRDLTLFPIDGQPIPLVHTTFNERAPQYSPDGKVIAYVSDEDGTDQIYLRGDTDNPRSIKVTSEGGSSASGVETARISSSRMETDYGGFRFRPDRSSRPAPRSASSTPIVFTSTISESRPMTFRQTDSFSCSRISSVWASTSGNSISIGRRFSKSCLPTEERLGVVLDGLAH